MQNGADGLLVCLTKFVEGFEIHVQVFAGAIESNAVQWIAMLSNAVGGARRPPALISLKNRIISVKSFHF